jgi:hypothetical protein
MLEKFAESEMRRAGLFDKDSDYGGMLAESVMKLIKVFADDGHSGMSAGMAVSLFEKLARYEPLTPLTGADDEWNEVSNGLFQNNRCSHVFKENGQAYDSQGRIFREPNGSCWISSDSRVPVTFPYVPKKEYIEIEAT